MTACRPLIKPGTAAAPPAPPGPPPADESILSAPYNTSRPGASNFLTIRQSLGRRRDGGNCGQHLGLNTPFILHYQPVHPAADVRGAAAALRPGCEPPTGEYSRTRGMFFAAVVSRDGLALTAAGRCPAAVNASGSRVPLPLGLNYI